jgi:hypothetical protein
VARKKGICTLCGKGGQLSFEHVPAEASGNLRGLVMHNLEEWLARDRTTGQLPGGIPQPEGMGLFALCEPCNRDLLGVHYVPAFVDFVEAGRQILADIAPGLDAYNARVPATHLGVRFFSIDRLAVAKQIVSMLLVTSGRGVVEANPALGEFVLKTQVRGLPSRYRLFLALTPGPAAKTTGLGTAVDLTTGHKVVAAEVVYPPFAYALSFNGTVVYSCGEITSWTAAEFGTVVEQELMLPLGFCHTVFLGDLRTQAEIERTRRENEGRY